MTFDTFECAIHATLNVYLSVRSRNARNDNSHLSRNLAGLHKRVALRFVSHDLTPAKHSACTIARGCLLTLLDVRNSPGRSLRPGLLIFAV